MLTERRRPPGDRSRRADLGPAGCQRHDLARRRRDGCRPGEPEGQPPAQIDPLKLASWQGSPIVKASDGLFRVKGGGVLPADEEATVRSGALEQSNVDATGILVQMVEAQRLFDMRTKLVASAKELDESGASADAPDLTPVIDPKGN